MLKHFLAGLNHRQIAASLYGPVKTDAEWYNGSVCRSRVRRRLKKTLHLMNGGYRGFFDL
ncbi:MAG: hypothetical protein COB46_14250 [Rhodospirillaceae bacterium]|nr:MAG: hypothetical protein COB46_14250 [Rhodospirillaceae bacterium]